MEAKGSTAPPHEASRSSWYHLLDEHGPLRTLFEDMGAVVTELDLDGRITYTTRTIEAVCGYHPAELVGVLGLELIHPEDHEQLEAPLPSEERGPDSSRVYRVRHKRGHWIWLETVWRTAPLASESAQRALVFARDVTPLKEARDALHQTEERYRTVVESTNDLVAEMDANGRIMFASPNIRQALGFSPAEIHGQSALRFVHPDDADRMARAFQDASASQLPTRFEMYRVQHVDGSWRWFQSTAIQYQHRSKEPRFLTVGRDISSVVSQARERMAFESRSAQAKRLESFGVMAGGVAHDFNNLLAPLLMETRLAIADLPEGDPALLRLERVERAVRKASAITNQMLSYAGGGDFEPAPLDLSQLVRRAAPALDSAAGSTASMSYELAQGLPPVLGDSRLLLDTLNQLVSNAMEASEPGGGAVALRTGTARPSNNLAVDFPGVPPSDECVFLEVEDEGAGMDQETREQSFDPFFTTRFTGRGLGLASVLGIVRAHSAAIELDSSPGRGTRIRILLPPAQNEPRQTDTPRAATSRGASGPITILVIEDDLGTREVIEEILSADGYRIIAAEDGARGARALEQHGEDIDLVILDFTLPGEPSPAVFERLRSIQPDVKVLLMSGHSQKRATRPFASESLSGFLPKPFLPEQLLDCIGSLSLATGGPQTRPGE